jgi:hypothetical protein
VNKTSLSLRNILYHSSLGNTFFRSKKGVSIKSISPSSFSLSLCLTSVLLFPSPLPASLHCTSGSLCSSCFYDNDDRTPRQGVASFALSLSLSLSLRPLPVRQHIKTPATIPAGLTLLPFARLLYFNNLNRHFRFMHATPLSPSLSNGFCGDRGKVIKEIKKKRYANKMAASVKRKEN